MKPFHLIIQTHLTFFLGSQATMNLVDDRPLINFSGVGTSKRATKLAGYLQKITNLIGGTYVDSPFYAAFGEKEITVHAM